LTTGPRSKRIVAPALLHGRCARFPSTVPVVHPLLTKRQMIPGEAHRLQELFYHPGQLIRKLCRMRKQSAAQNVLSRPTQEDVRASVTNLCWRARQKCFCEPPSSTRSHLVVIWDLFQLLDFSISPDHTILHTTPPCMKWLHTILKMNPSYFFFVSKCRKASPRPRSEQFTRESFRNLSSRKT
jgi:hypothetical protein